MIDNPPFSLRAEIVAFYQDHGVRFFLFSPSLTALCGRLDVCAVITDTDITYDNGAVVRTAFVTNMEQDCVLRTAPELGRILRAEDEKNRRKLVKELPKYAYPDEVLTAAIAQRWAHYGIEFRISPRECIFIRKLDAQGSQGKVIFGGGLLLSERAAAERAAAERTAAERAAAQRWQLSARERELIKHIGGNLR